MEPGRTYSICPDCGAATEVICVDLPIADNGYSVPIYTGYTVYIIYKCSCGAVWTNSFALEKVKIWYSH